MELEYIQANGKKWFPQEKGIQDPKKIKGVNLPYCIITKLWFGRWKVEYYDDWIYENHPHKTLIIYPIGIQEIRYNKCQENRN